MPDRHTDPGSTFDANLARYVNETRAKGGIPGLPVLPLDLHVLSLSLAFILSQDQTLHSNKNFKNYLFRSVIISVESLLGLALAVCFQTFQYL